MSLQEQQAVQQEEEEVQEDGILHVHLLEVMQPRIFARCFAFFTRRCIADVRPFPNYGMRNSGSLGPIARFW